MVARRIAPRVRLRSGRPRLHRDLRRRFDPGPLDRSHHLARRLAPLVPRREGARLRPPARRRRPAQAGPRATPAAVGALDRRRPDRRGPRDLEGAADAPRLPAGHRGRHQPPLGGGRADRLPLLYGRVAPPLLDRLERRGAAPAHPRQLHGGVHHPLPRRKVPGLRRERGNRPRRHRPPSRREGAGGPRGGRSAHARQGGRVDPGSDGRRHDRVPRRHRAASSAADGARRPRQAGHRRRRASLRRLPVGGARHPEEGRLQGERRGRGARPALRDPGRPRQEARGDLRPRTR